MSDKIHMLPEAIANQIAAGEVIQRPASVVKELLENAIDAKADQISLIIKNHGKSLIQVIDNGVGMTETDARMCFERHATSKIRTSHDLFHIKTMGFRGEALASIASIAEVELKTRMAEAEVATLIRIKSSEIIEQSYCQAEQGTSIAVKNLFFNVPARKKFLKTDAVELKYLLEEFKRVALANPEIKFRVFHNDNELYNLASGSLKKRILSLFRKSYEEKLIRVNEETDIIKINGLVGGPDIARKQKGEQYIFVNGRFIKNYYLNHAIKNAFDNLIGEDQYPFFVIFLEINPEDIDINVHPTKQEIKFDDDKLIYNYLRVAVKHALGRYSLSPQLDFENTESNIRPVATQQRDVSSSGGRASGPLASTIRSAPAMRNWQSLYNDVDKMDMADIFTDEEKKELTIPSGASGDILQDELPLDNDEKDPSQIHKSYILVQIKDGFIVIDQNLAHQRILYERYLTKLNAREEYTQRQLFPTSIRMSKDKHEVFEALIPELQQMGFDVQFFGGDHFVVNGIPAGFNDNNLQGLMDKLVDQYMSNLNLDISKNENIARSMALSASIKKGQRLNKEEMRTLVDELFACNNPYKSPAGKKSYVQYSLTDLEKLF